MDKRIESKQLAALLKHILVGYEVRAIVRFGSEPQTIELTKKSANVLLKSFASVVYNQDDEAKTVTISAD